jgi:hypothetical protein
VRFAFLAVFVSSGYAQGFLFEVAPPQQRPVECFHGAERQPVECHDTAFGGLTTAGPGAYTNGEDIAIVYLPTPQPPFEYDVTQSHQWFNLSPNESQNTQPVTVRMAGDASSPSILPK